ncbi:MAG TPA: ATP-dependent helicase, partial [Myxococcota bacterium]|nr:ATP-dependent helicase [Myxococcota bacterium]
PFWRAEARGRDAHYARRLLEFLESCEGAIVRGEIVSYLESFPQLTPRLRDGIEGVLEAQRRATDTPLPHRHHIVIERVVGGQRASADEQTREIIVHCGWGGRVNEPLAIVLAALWERENGYPLEVFADNDALVLLLPAECDPGEAFGPSRFRELARRGAVEALLRERLERSGRFGALFRENAGRALLLPKGGFSRRMPLWLNRIRSKKLLAATAALPDFPILLETWRTCLSDEFDLEALGELIRELASGEVAVSVCETLVPSPFAAELVWQQINLHMYQDDSLPGAGRSSLSDDLMREAVLSDSLRPMIRPAIVDQVESRLARRAPGYAPSGGSDLLDWITERVAVPASELRALEQAVVRDHGTDAWT